MHLLHLSVYVLSRLNQNPDTDKNWQNYHEFISTDTSSWEKQVSMVNVGGWLSMGREPAFWFGEQSQEQGELELIWLTGSKRERCPAHDDRWMSRKTEIRLSESQRESDSPESVMWQCGDTGSQYLGLKLQWPQHIWSCTCTGGWMGLRELN